MIWIKCVKNTVSWHHENSQALDLSMGFGKGKWRLSLNVKSAKNIYKRIDEHKGWAIGNHLREQHDMEPEDIAQSFRILRKCQNKFDCLIFEMFFIQELKPTLNKQCDSIRAKLFV